MPRSTDRSRRFLAVLAGLLLLVGHAGATGAAAPPVVVELKQFMFGPSTVTVVAGTTVAWKNLDPEPHTVASLDGAFRSGALDQGDSFTFTFTKPGTYRYVCSIHPQMTGTIAVTARP